jgi:serine/threonine-protein phosphatase 2A activator
MIKMYRAEVLGKLPVVQHFYFGSILPYTGPPLPTTEMDAPDSHCGHKHPVVPGRTGGWGDCCGIPVPSAFAAAKAEREREIGKPFSGPGIRPVPFD